FLGRHLLDAARRIRPEQRGRRVFLLRPKRRLGPEDGGRASMTIAVGIACPEGLVIGADSRASLVSDGYFRIVSDSTHKIFDIGGRFGAATFGWAFIEGNTIAGAIAEFVAETKR